MIQCPRCGGAIYEQSRFCPHCAYDIGQAFKPQGMSYPQAAAPAIACSVCGARLMAGAQFCPNCSTPVQPGPGYQHQGYQQPGYQQPAAPYPQMGYQQPYPVAPAKSSKKFLVIGIVAFVVIVALAGLYLLGSTLMSPANLTKEYLRAMEKGDYEAVKKLLAKDYKRQANVSSDVANASKWLKDSGGIKDIIIDKEDVSENVATINYTVKLGNGASKSGSTRFVKEERKWKLYEDQTPVALTP